MEQKTLGVFKDMMTYEHKQQPTHLIRLENIIKVQVYKFTPPTTGQENGNLEPLDLNQTLNQSVNGSFIGLPKKRQVMLQVILKINKLVISPLDRM